MFVFCSLLQFLPAFLAFLQSIRFVLEKRLLVKQIIPDMSEFVLHFGEFRCEFGYFRGVVRCLGIFGRNIIVCVLESSFRSAVFLESETLSLIHTQKKRKLSVMFVVYSSIFFTCSLIFFTFAPAFAWCE